MEIRHFTSRLSLRLIIDWGVVIPSARRFAAVTLACLLAVSSASAQNAGPPPSNRPAPPPRTNPAPAATRPGQDAARAQRAYQDGIRAEQAGNWQAAYTAYSEAVTFAPDNAQFTQYREHARFQLVQEIVALADKLLVAG